MAMIFMIPMIVFPILFLILPVWLFLLPLSRAYLAGLAVVRDPAVRVTPLDPGVIFSGVVRRKLRRIRVFWITVLGISLVILVISVVGWWVANNELSNAHRPIYSPAIGFATILGSVVGLTLLQLCCAYWAPKCQKTWSLVTLSLATWFLLKILLSVVSVPFYAFPGLLGELIQCAIVFGIYGYYWRHSLRRSTHWFRFEE